MNASPTYLRGYGEIASRQAALGWGLTITAVVVSAVVAALVLAACLRRRPSDAALLEGGRVGGVRWIVVGGVVVPAVILAVALVFTLGTLSATAAPRRSSSRRKPCGSAGVRKYGCPPDSTITPPPPRLAAACTRPGPSAPKENWPVR